MTPCVYLPLVRDTEQKFKIYSSVLWFPHKRAHRHHPLPHLLLPLLPVALEMNMVALLKRQSLLIALSEVKYRHLCLLLLASLLPCLGTLRHLPTRVFSPSLCRCLDPPPPENGGNTVRGSFGPEVGGKLQLELAARDVLDQVLKLPEEDWVDHILTASKLSK